MKKLSEIVGAVKDYPVKRVAVAAAEDPTVLEAVKAAKDQIGGLLGPDGKGTDLTYNTVALHLQVTEKATKVASSMAPLPDNVVLPRSHCKR